MSTRSVDRLPASPKLATEASASEGGPRRSSRAKSARAPLYGAWGLSPEAWDLLLLTLGLLFFPDAALSQAPREQVRVPKRHANIQAGPSSGSIVLVLVPQGTVLTVLERQGPWVVVELTPKLREVGTPMRWYRGEKRGFMHESTVEVVR